MAIQSVTSVTQAPTPPPVPAPAPPGQVAAKESAPPAAVPVPPPAATAPPPAPPAKGFDMDVEVGFHEETNTKVYNFVDPDSGDTVVQIPMEKVLNMIAGILQQLEAEGRR
jgi:hypothetical protein